MTAMCGLYKHPPVLIKRNKQERETWGRHEVRSCLFLHFFYSVLD